MVLPGEIATLAGDRPVRLRILGVRAFARILSAGSREVSLTAPPRHGSGTRNN